MLPAHANWRANCWVDHLHSLWPQAPIWSTSWCWNFGQCPHHRFIFFCSDTATCPPFHNNPIATATVYGAWYISDQFLSDKAINLVDKAASSLRLAQDSKPDELEALNQEIVTLQIKLKSLKNKLDVFSVEQWEKLEQDLALKKEEAEQLTSIWHADLSLNFVYSFIMHTS